jgi:hypothetical protein
MARVRCLLPRSRMWDEERGFSALVRIYFRYL